MWNNILPTTIISPPRANVCTYSCMYIYWATISSSILFLFFFFCCLLFFTQFHYRKVVMSVIMSAWLKTLKMKLTWFHKIKRWKNLIIHIRKSRLNCKSWNGLELSPEIVHHDVASGGYALHWICITRRRTMNIKWWIYARVRTQFNLLLSFSIKRDFIWNFIASPLRKFSTASLILNRQSISLNLI